MVAAGAAPAASIDAVESLLGTAEALASCPAGLRLLVALWVAIAGAAADRSGARALAFSPAGAGAGASRPFSPGDV